jgi:hypothetical protein
MDECLLCHRHPRRVAALCQSCHDKVTDALTQAPALYVHGCQGVSGSSHGLTDKLSTPKPGSRSPLRDGVLELCDALARSLLSWEAATRAALDRPQLPAAVRAGHGVQRAAATISADLAAALGPPYGVAHASHLLTLSASLRDRLGLTPLVHQLAAPCPNCDTRALVRRDGDDHVSCRMCGNSWPERHYALLARLLVAESSDEDTK